MTTNVRDSLIGELATDSRWSIDCRAYGIDAIIVIDDTGFEKIICVGHNLFMFAGDSSVIASWKNSITDSHVTGKLIPWAVLQVNKMAISIVEVESGKIIYEFGHQINLPEGASFAGTGSFAAAGCWTLNKNPQKAVDTAKVSDRYTGGTVRYFNFMDNRNNLVPDMPLSHLTQQLSTRNVVMQANSTSPISVGEAAKNDESMKTILEKIASGEIRAAAPCDAVFNVWPDDEKKKLIQAMEKIFPAK